MFANYSKSLSLFRTWYIFSTVIFLSCVGSTISSSAASVPKSYSIDLDSRPYIRWKQICVDEKPWLSQMIKEILLQRIPASVLPSVEEIANNLEQYLSPPYAEELKGFAYYCGMNVSDLVIVNLIYEATAFCTSTVAVDTKNRIWHGRNFDYGWSKDDWSMFKNGTFIANFTRGGKTLYTGVTFVGYVGIPTGFRQGQFSISLNERDKGSWLENLLTALYTILKTKTLNSAGFIARTTLEKAENFDDAVQLLKTVPLVAPIYFIVGGLSKNQGVIITRSHLQTLDVFQIDVEKGRWFVLETNYDRWLPPPKSDDRRHPGMRAMNAMGRGNITSYNLLKVLSTPPVMNRETIFSAVMSAGNPGAFRLVVRF